MEARFVVNRQCRKGDSVAFARVTYGKNRIVYLVLTLLYWGIILYRLRFGLGWLDAFFILVAVLFTLLTILYPQYMGWRVRRAGNKRAQITGVVYNFRDENFEISTDLDEGTAKYDALMKIVEDKNYFFLFVQKYSAYIVPKCDFTSGDPAEFSAFIAEKTGLEVKHSK